MTINISNQIIIKNGQIRIFRATPTSQTFAVQYNATQVDYVQTIKANSTIIYDINNPSATNDNYTFEIFTGRPGQPKSAIIQQIEGPTNTPTFSGIAYVVFKDFNFIPFGGTMPTITITFSIGGTLNCSETILTVPATGRLSVQPKNQPFVYGGSGTNYWKIDALTKSILITKDLSTDTNFFSSAIQTRFTFDPLLPTKGFFGTIDGNDGRVYEFDTSTLSITNNSGLQSFKNVFTISNVQDGRFATGSLSFSNMLYFDTVNVSPPILFGNVATNADMITIGNVNGSLEIFIIKGQTLTHVRSISELNQTFNVQSFNLSADLPFSQNFITYSSFTNKVIVGSPGKLVEWDPITQTVTNTLVVNFLSNNKAAFLHGEFNGKLYLRETSSSIVEIDLFNFTFRSINMPNCTTSIFATIYDQYNHAVWTNINSTTMAYQPLDRYTGGTIITDGPTSVIYQN